MVTSFVSIAQNIDKTDSIASLKVKNSYQIQFKAKQLIIPVALIGYGIIGIGSDQLEAFNFEIREEVKENIDRKFSIDDFSQYAPVASVYALGALGIKGKNWNAG